MALAEKLTTPERDEVGELLTTILTDVVNGERSIKRAVAGLRQPIDAAISQNPDLLNQLRAAAYT